MTDGHLKRRLGLGLLTLYGVGVMVGAGIYVLIGAVVGEAGSLAPVAFIIAGLISAPTAISYAELSVRIPQSAGEAAYLLRATNSGLIAALIGLAVALIGVVSAGAILQGGVGYLMALVDLPREALIVGIGLILCGFAVWGVLESMAFVAVFTLVEIGGLLLIVAVGAAAEPMDYTPPPGAVTPALMAGALLAFFAFVGFEDMVNMAEETKAPERTMPRAIIIALIVTTLLYVAVAWAAVRAAPFDRLAGSSRPLADVYETATGGDAGFLALIAVVAALNGVLAQIVMAARVLFGLGRFSAPFNVFHRAHPRFGTPVAATLLAAGAMIALALAAPIALLAEWTSATLLVVFVFINGSLLVIRWRDGPSPGFSAPLIAPVAGVIFSVAAFTWVFL